MDNDELNELNKKIGLLRGETPKLEYLVMDQQEHGIFIEFDRLWDATEFMKTPHGMSQALNYGAHVVQREKWVRYANDIACAWCLLDDIMRECFGVTVGVNHEDGYFCTITLESGSLMGRSGKTAPEAISKVYVVWKGAK